jgi:hypothetical protein
MMILSDVMQTGAAINITLQRLMYLCAICL